MEPWAVAALNRFVKTLSDEDMPDGEHFEKYFLRYQKKRDLVLRTSALTRDEYLKSPGVQDIPSDLTDKLVERLPSVFWITEISVPELFWINKGKIGEIITHPELFSEDRRNAVIFVRLPNMVVFVEGSNSRYFPIEQSKPHHPIILAEGLAHFMQ